MADTISTSTEMVRVPILGENGRISDEYIPAAIGESVDEAKQVLAQAKESQAAAQNSAEQASQSASDASSSVTITKQYSDNAATYMATAQIAADTATQYSNDAQQAKQDAANSATAAQESAKQAAQSADGIDEYASQAKQAATDAQTYAKQANDAYVAVANSTTEAKNAASGAAESAGQASASAQQAAQSAQQAADSASGVGASVTEAKSAAAQAAQSAQAAQDSVTKAQEHAGNAATSATSASDSASAASQSASAASGSASAAKTSETNAASSASAASTSATNAAASATAAEQSKNDAAALLEQADAKFINGATATTLEPGADATAEVVDNILNLGIPRGEGIPSDNGKAGQLLQTNGDGTTKWVDAPSGNTLVGTTPTGEYVAHAEDAYAAKPREVRIEGRTVNNLWPVFNGSSDGSITGVTATTDETGLITVSGTSTAVIRSIITVVIPAQAGKTYTVVTTSANSGMGSLNYEIVIDASRSSFANEFISNMFSPTNGGPSKTFTTPDGTVGLACIIRVDTGLTVNASFRVMLVEGTEAPDCFTPTGIHGVEPENLVTAGRNLLPQDAKIYEAAYNRGRAYLKNREAQFQLAIQVESDGYGLYIPIAIGEQYTISLDDFNNDGFTAGIFWAVYQNEEDIFYYNKELQHGEATATTTTTTTTTGSFLVIVFAGRWTDGTTNVGIFNKVATGLRVELGSTATAYEPPNVTEVTLPEMDALMDGDALTVAQDGAVTVSRADGTTDQLGTVTLPQLPAPTFNVYPTGGYVPPETGVEYERDVNITISNMQEVIDSLVGGGN